MRTLKVMNGSGYWWEFAIQRGSVVGRRIAPGEEWWPLGLLPVGKRNRAGLIEAVRSFGYIV
jgi:hypothetical protein